MFKVLAQLNFDTPARLWVLSPMLNTVGCLVAYRHFLVSAQRGPAVAAGGYPIPNSGMECVS
jgi:hypothetical protein